MSAHYRFEEEGYYKHSLWELLVSKGVDINAQNNLGQTHLMVALEKSENVRYDRREIEEILQITNFDPNIQDNNGNTIFHYFAKHYTKPVRHSTSFKIFGIRNLNDYQKIDLNIKNNNQETCMDILIGRFGIKPINCI